MRQSPRSQPTRGDQPSTRARAGSPPWRRLSAVAALGVCACASQGEGDTRRELLGAWSNQLIVPGYQSLAEASQALDSSLGALCGSPSAAALASTQAAWSTARERLKEMEVFAFGPYSRPGFRHGPPIDSGPAQPDRISEILDGAGDVSAASVAGFAISQRGLPALEYLLFADGAEDGLADERRCAYLQGLGADLADTASQLHLAWAPEGGNWAAELSDAGRGGTAFRSLNHAFSEVVNRLGLLAFNVRDLKLDKPLGDNSASGNPVPEEVESRFSGRGVDDIRDNLEGIERVYFGASGAPGLNTYVAERGDNLDAEVSQALADSRQALSAIPGSLAQAVVDAPESVRAASAALGTLQGVLQVDVLRALAIDLGFNDNDGD